MRTSRIGSIVMGSRKATQGWRVVAAVGVLSLNLALPARSAPSTVPAPVRNAAPDIFVPSDRTARASTGYLGDRMRINVEKRLLAIDLDTILGPFENRAAGQWWLGEHAGKFIHAGTLAWRSSGDERLKQRVDEAVKRLVVAQLPNGYLGTYPEKDRFVERDGVSWDGPVWDVWAHKYCLVGLLTYYQATGNPSALAASRRAADLLCETFGPGKKSLVRASSHVGMASTSVLEPMAVLYRLTGERRYLDFCHSILNVWEQPPASRILTSLLEHGNVHKTANNKAYEMLSNLVGLMELYRLEGDARYLRACQAAWDDVLHRRLYPIGTTSYAEHFTDDFVLPLGPLGDEKEPKIGEGCVTVTWLQLTLQLLQATGLPKYADALERTLYNALPGAQSPLTGKVCYFIPLNGHRRFGEVSHGLRPDISCCSSSIPRGLALIPECLCGTLNGTPAILQYEAGTYRVMATLEGSSVPVELHIGAGYPELEQFVIEVRPTRMARFALLLRVPAWAESFVASVGETQFKGEAGRMLRLEREWAPGDTVHVSLPMGIQTHKDPDRASKRVWLSRGPQVLAADGDIKDGDLPSGWWGRQVYRVTEKRKQEVLTLTPFAEAGQRQQTYTTLFEDLELAPSQERAQLPPDREYVVADREGHLSLDGARVRYWGVIGGFPHAPELRAEDTPQERRNKIAAAYADVDALVQRFMDLGFNLNRSWSSADTEDYKPGDGSRADIVDYYISVMKKRGLKLWAAGINRLGNVTPEDAGVIDAPATADDWKQAIRGWNNGQVGLGKNLAARWDPRLLALTIERRRINAQHFNRHTGLRWSDDPVFVAWELSNEEWWMSKMVGGQWQALPEYFQRSLIAEWHRFLRDRYRDETALKRKWKTLLPGEDLSRGTVQLLPLARKSPLIPLGMDEQGRQQLLAAGAGTHLEYGAADFAPERGEDVLAFFVSLHVSSKQREAEALRGYGKSCRLSSLAWDTGIGYEIQSQYLHQMSGVSVHDAYVNGWGWKEPEPAAFPTAQSQRRWEVGAESVEPNRGPWNCWLEKPPGIAQGLPWLEHNKIEGKPFFAYETQISQPAKYRADFPLRLAMLASIQDWDIACWHYYAPPRGLASKDRPFDQPMDNTVGGHPQGYHYTFDEVQGAMMRAAGLIWRRQLLLPASQPTRFIYGRKSLYDPLSMNYGHSYGDIGMDMRYTTYQYGVRIAIDPSREDDEVIGPRVRFADRHSFNPYIPTPQMTLDWRKGYLAFDAPGAVAFAGFLPRVGGSYRFANGVVLQDISIRNPAGSYDPVSDDEGYLAFALFSQDGKPLAEAKQVSLSLVSTSFNTGFSMARNDFEGLPDSPLKASATPKRQNGRLPVLVTRVGARLQVPALEGMKYLYRDWHLKTIGAGEVQGGRLVIPADQPIFCIDLTR